VVLISLRAPPPRLARYIIITGAELFYSRRRRLNGFGCVIIIIQRERFTRLPNTFKRYRVFGVY